MMCSCENHLVETVNKTEDNRNIYICENCKKYYIKGHSHIWEIEFKHQEWRITGDCLEYKGNKTPILRKSSYQNCDIIVIT
jgi:hypothetical protein